MVIPNAIVIFCFNKNKFERVFVYIRIGIAIVCVSVSVCGLVSLYIDSSYVVGGCFKTLSEYHDDKCTCRAFIEMR